MKTIKFKLICILLSLPWLAQAQLSRYAYNYEPVSPAAESLMKKVHSPVNYSTGALDLNIPLYEIKTKDLTLPIILRCNTSGVKNSDDNGIVGVGWDLEYGPSISRQIQGSADEYGYLRYNPYFERTDLSYLTQYNEHPNDPGYDGKPDIFFYSTLNSSGKFVFKRPKSDEEERNYTPIFFPYNGDSLTTSGYFQHGLWMTDTQAITYAYGTSESSREISRSQNDRITGWKIDRIYSQHGDEISFNYREQTLIHDVYEDQYILTDNGPGYDHRAPDNGYWKCVNGVMDFWEYIGPDTEISYDKLIGKFQPVGYDLNLRNQPCKSRTSTHIKTQYPTQINFNNGNLSFAYNSLGLLNQLTIYERNVLLQTITFHYTQSTMTRYRLSRLEIKDEVTGNVKNYYMDYYIFGGGYPASKAIDHWGYYNGQTGNTDLVPRHTVEFTDRGQYRTVYAEIGGADREPNLCARDHSIRSIYYPNGAREEFDYGHNLCCLDDGTEVITPGIRIESIRYYDVDGNLRSDRRLTYELSNVNAANAVPNFMIEQNKIKSYITDRRRTYRLRTFMSQPIANGYIACGIPTLYSAVTEHDELAVYPMKRHYRQYDTSAAILPYGGNYFLINPMRDYRGKEVVKETVRSISSMTPLKTIEYQYKQIGLPGRDINETETRDIFPRNIVEFIGHSPSYDEWGDFYNFDIMDSYVLGNSRVVTNRTVEYIGEEGARMQTDYFYGSTLHDIKSGKPLETWVANSDDSREITQYEYPYHVSGDVYRHMVNRNDIIRPVTIKTKKGYMEKEHILFNYKIEGGTVLSSVQYADQQTDDVKTLEEYTRHDSRGNVCELYKEDRVPITLIWGYNHSRLIAVIQGENYANVMSSLGCGYNEIANMDDELFLNRMASLRISLPHAHITAYLHEPTRGIKCIVAPNGNKITYASNGFGHMVESRDYNNAILQYNKYQYK